MENEYRHQKKGVSCGVLPFCPRTPEKGIEAGEGFPNRCRSMGAGIYFMDYNATGMMREPPGYIWEMMGW